MRVGKIIRVVVDGDLVTVDATLDQGKEEEITATVLLGMFYNLEPGDSVLVLPLGEVDFLAIPGGYLVATLTAVARVSLEIDWNEINRRLTDVEQNLIKHQHNVPIGAPLNPTPTTPGFVTPSTVPPIVPALPATFTGSDKVKLTHG